MKAFIDRLRSHFRPVTQAGKQRTTLSGKPPEVTEGPAPGPIDPATGMHTDYWVLPKKQRTDFVRPLRDSYIHKYCGHQTRMAPALAETYAKSPRYYSHTYCSYCKRHLPVSEFRWTGTNDEDVGS